MNAKRFTKTVSYVVRDMMNTLTGKDIIYIVDCPTVIGGYYDPDMDPYTGMTRQAWTPKSWAMERYYFKHNEYELAKKFAADNHCAIQKVRLSSLYDYDDEAGIDDPTF